MFTCAVAQRRARGGMDFLYSESENAMTRFLDKRRLTAAPDS
jgi:hypothetical protein